MQFIRTSLDGACVIELDRHIDDRGTFARTFCEEEFAAAGLPIRYPQCNLSSSKVAGTLRGMHFEPDSGGNAKLVRCVRGAIRDVIIDLRAGSSTRFQWLGIDLSADNGRALFIPSGFGHGFLTLEDRTDVYYHMEDSYRPGVGGGARWDDPALGIEWPTTPVVISERDASYPDIDPDTFDLDA